MSVNENNLPIDSSKIINYTDEGQRLSLEKYINSSLAQFEKTFQKKEILKFLYKYIQEDILDFSEEIKSENKEITEEEISSKKDKLCRELKKLFDSINPDIFKKYKSRLAAATN